MPRRASPRVTVSEKPCSQCGRTLPASKFPPNARQVNGLGSWCRDCGNERKRQFRIENPEYAIWRDMVRRCANKKRKDYPHYGGRGIRVCDEWLGPDGFQRFLKDVGRRPSRRHSIDRVDNDGNYAPGNVRWATQKEQTRNFSRTRLVTAMGRTQCLAAWSEDLNVPPRLIQQRLDYLGWPPEDAVSLPPGAKRGAA